MPGFVCCVETSSMSAHLLEGLSKCANWQYLAMMITEGCLTMIPSDAASLVLCVCKRRYWKLISVGDDVLCDLMIVSKRQNNASK